MSLYNVNKFDKVYIPKDKIYPPVSEIGKRGAGIESVIFNDDNGNDNKADGNYSFTAGHINKANGQYSNVSGGFTNTASAQYSTVGGGAWNTAENEGAFSTGLQNNATGQAATAIGRKNKATGAHSLAGGYNTQAQGDDSVSFGEKSVVYSAGKHSIASGYQTSISSENCICSGYMNTINTNSNNSLCSGQKLTVNNKNCLVCGQYNNTTRTNIDNKPVLFEIGSGMNASWNGSGYYIRKIDPASGSNVSDPTLVDITINKQQIIMGKDEFKILTFSKENEAGNLTTPRASYTGNFEYIIFNDKIKIIVPFGDGVNGSSHNKFIFSKRSANNLQQSFINQIYININFEEIIKILNTYKPSGKTTRIAQDNIGTCSLNVNYSKTQDATRYNYQNFYRWFIKGNTSYSSQYQVGLIVVLGGGIYLNGSEEEYATINNLPKDSDNAYYMYNPEIKDLQYITFELRYIYADSN